MKLRYCALVMVDPESQVHLAMDLQSREMFTVVSEDKGAWGEVISPCQDAESSSNTSTISVVQSHQDSEAEAYSLQAIGPMENESDLRGLQEAWRELGPITRTALVCDISPRVSSSRRNWIRKELASGRKIDLSKCPILDSEDIVHKAIERCM